MNSNPISIPKFEKYLHYGLPSLLFLFCLYRAIRLDFTNDEAFSFLNIAQMNIHMMCGTANTHWLNSFFMWIEHLIFGNKEWMLRLHSPIAMFFFAYFTLKLFRLHFEWKLIWIPITLLLLNNYLLDFFSLARGYSLSITFELLAFYFIVKNKKEHVFKIYLFLSLATFSNYTFIYILYSYFLLNVIQAFRKGLFRSMFNLNSLKEKAPLILISIWALPNIIFIKYFTGDLEEGEKNGFFQDTLSEFFERSFTTISEKIWVFVLLILFVGIFLFYAKMRTQLSSGVQRLFEILLLNFVLIYVFFWVLHIPFPYGRTAIFYIIPFLIALCFTSMFFLQKISSIFQICVIVVLFGLNLWNSIQNRDFRVTIEWWKQQGLKACLNDLYSIEKENIKQVKIGMSIDHYGSFLNYYRFLKPSRYCDSVFMYSRLGYENMTTWETEQFPKQDYLLMLEDYKPYLNKVIPESTRVLIETYPSMKTDLLSLKNP